MDVSNAYKNSISLPANPPNPLHEPLPANPPNPLHEPTYGIQVYKNKS
jgi:hypothetical protein